MQTGILLVHNYTTISVWRAWSVKANALKWDQFHSNLFWNHKSSYWYRHVKKLPVILRIFHDCTLRLRVLISLCVIKFHTASQVFHMIGSQTLVTCCVNCEVSNVRFLGKVKLEFYMWLVTTAAWLLVCSVDLVLDTYIPMSLILSTSIHTFGMIN